MFEFGKCLVLGTVTKVDDRSGVAARTGKPWRIVTVFIVHAEGAYRVQLSDDLVRRGLPEAGDDLAVVVSPEVFNGSVVFRALSEWDGSIPARAAVV